MGIENIRQIGPRSQREMVAEALAAADYGELVSYDLLGSLIDLPFARSNEQDRRKVQRVVQRALSELETVHHKTAVPVPKEGYRVADPREHVTVGQRRQTRANKALRRASRVVKAADHNRLTPAERAENLEAQRLLRAQEQAARTNTLARARRELVAAALVHPPTITN